MESIKTERQFALIRIESGDYLLPSNDRATLWRIARYTDGPTNGLDIPSDRQFWGLWKWDGPMEPNLIDIEDWNRWEQFAGLLATRQEAIDEAMKT